MESQRLTRLFVSLQSRLTGTARRLLGNDDDAADALQDVFCTLWHRRHSIDDDGMAEGLAAVSLRNRCLDTLRRRSSHRQVSVDEIAPEAVEQPDEDRDELYRQVDRAITMALGERDRRILILREQAGWEMEEIAQEFDMTPAAVRMALSRARRAVLSVYQTMNHD